MKEVVMRRPGSNLLLAAALTLVGAVAAWPSTAVASDAIITRGGTLYEVVETRYGDVVAGVPAGSAENDWPVLALRTSPFDGPTRLELIDGTVDEDKESSASIEYDEDTDSVFVVYTKFQNLYADVRIAIRRQSTWLIETLRPNPGLYYSLNPDLVVTRQKYVVTVLGVPTEKWRSILNLVWWEESGISQARYASFFLEDGQLLLDPAKAYDLNLIAGASGPTPPTDDLPFSSYQYPAVQRDPASNGGVLVSFANLVNGRYQVLGISFEDPGAVVGDPGQPQYSRGHTPVGRVRGDVRIPTAINTPHAVGTVISASTAVPTFFWEDAAKLSVLRGDSPEGAAPFSIAYRPDLGRERALYLVRQMVEKY